jgi:hypothetical protein
VAGIPRKNIDVSVRHIYTARECLLCNHLGSERRSPENGVKGHIPAFVDFVLWEALFFNIMTPPRDFKEQR